MEIFKLYESTMANIEPGHISTRDLRRDQILDLYDEGTKTLQALIKAKENEITYRQDLLNMLEKSKVIYDNKLTKAKQNYQDAKKHAPDSLDLKVTSKKVDPNTSSSSTGSASNNLAPTTMELTPNLLSPMLNTITPSSQSSQKSSDFDLPPLPSESQENRNSLDKRLSEFLKTFPNLTQAGLAPTSNNNNVKPLPGYYTQQPQPPSQPAIVATPPLMAMMRFPPPPLIPPPPPQAVYQSINTASKQENYDTADMDLSDYEEQSNNGGTSGGIPPMIASAMQQGAGGNKHLRNEAPQSYMSDQQYNNPTVQYAPRLNPLAFDPSIVDSRLRDSSSSSGGRDKHSHSSDRGSQRSSSGSSGSGVKHESDKNKYPSSSSHSSNRSKRR